jgi:TolA-binding protein
LRLKESNKSAWAKDLILQAMRKYPEWWLPYQLLGESEFENKAWKNAVFYLDQAVRWNPLSKKSFLKLFEAQTQLKLSEEAQSTLAYALAIYPDAPELQTRYWQNLEQKPGF